MRIDWKNVIISILIGAVIAGLTSLMEGALEFLQGLGNNGAGGLSAAFWYAFKNRV